MDTSVEIYVPNRSSESEGLTEVESTEESSKAINLQKPFILDDVFTITVGKGRGLSQSYKT